MTVKEIQVHGQTLKLYLPKMSVDEDIKHVVELAIKEYAKEHTWSILDEYAGIFLHFHKSTDIKKYDCRRYYPKYQELEQSRNLCFLASNT